MTIVIEKSYLCVLRFMIAHEDTLYIDDVADAPDGYC